MSIIDKPLRLETGSQAQQRRSENKGVYEEGPLSIGAPVVMPLLLASAVIDVIAVVGVLPSSAAIYSGGAATWALLTGQSGTRVAEQAAFGLAVGFLVGIPLTICAGLALALSS